jgi:hypothetical protein
VVDPPEPARVLCNVVAHHSLARLRHPPTNALPESNTKFFHLRWAGHDHVRQLLPHIIKQRQATTLGLEQLEGRLEDHRHDALWLYGAHEQFADLGQALQTLLGLCE